MSDIFLNVSQSTNGMLATEQNFAEAQRRIQGHTHEQTTPYTVWNVAHNLGYRPSSFSIWINNQAAYAAVEHIDNNTLTVTFRSAKSGTFKCQ